MATENQDAGTASDSASTTETETPKYAGLYDVVDPGYSGPQADSDDDDISFIRNQNKKKPSETSGDASGTEGKASRSDAEETAETPSDEGSTDDFSDELLDRAVALGYELDDIREFTDAKALERELSRVEKLQQKLQGRKQATESETPSEAETTEEETEPNWQQMIDEGHSEDTVKILKANYQRAAKAEAALKQLQQAENIRAAEVASNRFDDALNALPDEYEGVLGKGRLADLQKSNPTVVENRKKVYQKMVVLQAGYKASGQKVPSESELIEEAVNASFSKQAIENARKSVRTQLKKAGSQALSRPRSGNDKSIPGPERALQKEDAFWKRFDG